jgi:hypothetical protein
VRSAHRKLGEHFGETAVIEVIPAITGSGKVPTTRREA